MDFAAITRSTRDFIVTMPRAEAIDVLSRAGVDPVGVQFFAEDTVLSAVVRTLSVQPRARWAPGGSLSNTLAAMASCQGVSERSLVLHWIGLAEYGDYAGHVSPIDSLRRYGIRIFCQPTAGYRRFAICIISQETGEVLCILISTRDEPIEFSPDWPVMDGIVTTVREVALASDQLFDYMSTAASIAVMTADHELVDDATMDRLRFLAQAVKLKFVIGHYDEFVRLGFVIGSRVVSDFQETEFVGTQSEQPVRVWSPLEQTFQDYPVAATHLKVTNALGAGDAYAGGYLLHRLLGASVVDAHLNGARLAARALSSPSAQILPDDNLNKEFGFAIDRTSQRANEGELFERIRLSPGLVVVSCGQTGTDQIGLQTASELGLPAYGILPLGRRTEATEGVDEIEDDFGDAYVVELQSPSYRYCTWANAYLSDGTLLWDFSGSEGSAETRRACASLGRPILEISHIPPDAICSSVADLISTHNIRVVNIAGNRARFLTAEQRRTVQRQVEQILKFAAWYRMQLNAGSDPRGGALFGPSSL